MNKVLTVLTNRAVDGLTQNHAHYTRAYGYAYAIADGTHVFGRRQAVLYKYQAIFHELVGGPDGCLVLVLDQFSVVYGAQALGDVAKGYDALVTSQAPASELPAASGMIFRNTPTIRERMRALVLEIGKWAVYLSECVACEEVTFLARAFPVLRFESWLASGHFASAQAVWDDGLSIDSVPEPLPLVAHNAPRWQCRNVEWTSMVDYDFRYVLALPDDFRQVANGATPHAGEGWHIAKHHVRASAVHVNIGARIAFVTLNTSDIAGYSETHEENFVRYCRRHGYAYHVYRKSPNDVPDGITANWAKPYLIRNHLEEHALVFWVDAHLLAINQCMPIDEAISGRDFCHWHGSRRMVRELMHVWGRKYGADARGDRSHLRPHRVRRRPFFGLRERARSASDPGRRLGSSAC